jgi:hypothetical protein
MATANILRHRIAVPLIFLLLSGPMGCSSAPPLARNSLSVALCSSRLPLPDTTPDGAARKPFEEKMVRIGLFKRLGQVTLSDRRHATLYDAVPSKAADLTYITRRTSSQPAIVQVCYGTLRATRITRLVRRSENHYFAEFNYEVRLKRWARSFYAFLHLKPRGDATDELVAQHSFLEGTVLATGGLKGIPTTLVERPPNGISWYGPGQFPIKFRWPPVSV